MSRKITKLIFAIFLFPAMGQCSQFTPYTMKQDTEYRGTNLPSATSYYPNTSKYPFLHGHSKGKTYPTHNISEDELNTVYRINNRLATLKSNRIRKRLSTPEYEKSMLEIIDVEYDDDKGTRLLFAAQHNLNFLAFYLLDRGADPTKSDYTFTRPLDIAKKNNNQYLVDILQHAINKRVEESKKQHTYYDYEDPVIMNDIKRQKTS